MYNTDDGKLIEAVRTRPLIYTKGHRHHANRELLTAAWEAVALEVGGNVTVVDCRRRWATLRDHFRKKHREMTCPNPDTSAPKRRKWYLYDQLTFLAPDFTTIDNFQIKTEDVDLSGDEDLPHTPFSAQSEESDSVSQSACFRKSLGLISTKIDQTSAVEQDISPVKINQTSAIKNDFPSMSIDQTLGIEPHLPLMNVDQMSAVEQTVSSAHTKPQQEVDHNELFFKSLLPAMKTLDMVQTLELRSEIQLLVLSYVKTGRSSRVE